MTIDLKSSTRLALCSAGVFLDEMRFCAAAGIVFRPVLVSCKKASNSTEAPKAFQRRFSTGAA